MVVTHREYIKDFIVSAVDFAAQTYCINPGCKATFPWLAQIAVNYEQYTIKRMAFEFISRVATTFGGSVGISTDYDVTDSPPTSSTEALNRQGTIESAAYRSIRSVLSPLALKALSGLRYVRSGNVAGDLKTYDSANVTVFSDTLSEIGNLGKVFVDYEIELITPVTLVPRVKCSTLAAFAINESTPARTILIPDDANASTPIAANSSEWSETCNPLSIVTSDTSPYFSVPRGSYMVQADITYQVAPTEDPVDPGDSFVFAGIILNGGLVNNYIAASATFHDDSGEGFTWGSLTVRQPVDCADGDLVGVGIGVEDPADEFASSIVSVLLTFQPI
jgi:hypothetical protein